MPQTTTSPLVRLYRAGLDLLYPPRCVLCGGGGAFVCGECAAALPRADGRRCPRCWLPLLERDCRVCAVRPLALARLRSGFRYEGDARRLVHELKFRGVSALADPMAALIVDSLSDGDAEAECIVPVPLAGNRRRTRGFNQSAMLAKGIGERVGLTVVDALRRTRSSRPQAESASAEERRRNVEGAFAVPEAELVARRIVILVDDVATTGSTLDACARALLAAGAASVVGLTFARED